jgi:AraC family transcriptional regulator, transcriptional activator of pobA
VKKLYFSFRMEGMTDPTTAVRRKGGPSRAGARIPSFSLYGEAPEPQRELLHVEDVQSRSRLYRWEIRPHVHQGLYQVVWLMQGRADVVLDEWRGEVGGPAAIIVPPGVAHGFKFAPGTDGHVLTLSARLLMEGDYPSAGKAFRELFLSPGVMRFGADDRNVGRIDSLMRELSAEFASPLSSLSPVLLWLARAVVWRLAHERSLSARAGEAGVHRHQALFSRFLLLVEEHFLERWPLTRYARKLGLSIQRLNRLARGETGRPALEIVHERLTREACRRLFYIAAPAEKLALELGFEDPGYFNRFFKRRTGLTPRRWREQNRLASEPSPESDGAKSRPEIVRGHARR